MQTKKEKGISYYTLKILQCTFHLYPFSCIAVLLLIIINALSNVLIAILLYIFIDGNLLPLLQGQEQYTSMFIIIGYMTLAYGLGLLSNYFYHKIMIIVTRGTTKVIRIELFSHLMKLPKTFYDHHNRGEIMSVFTNDTDTLRQMINQSIPQLFSAFTLIIAILFFMIILNKKLFMLVAILASFMFVSIRYVVVKSSDAFISQQKKLAMLNGYMEEMLDGQETIKIFAHEKDNLRGFKNYNNKLKEGIYNTQKFSNALYPLMSNMNNLAYILVAMFGILIINHSKDFSVGTLVSFLWLCRLLVQPIVIISQQMNYLITAMAGSKRIFDLLDETEELDTGWIRIIKSPHHYQWFDEKNDSIKEAKGDVVFDHVDFMYDNSKEVLKQISFHIKQGEIVAFVGTTGAGKTTILNLINRFYDIQRGKILIDGIDILTIKKTDLRKIIGIVTQDVTLLKGTIKENIAFGLNDIDELKVIEAAKKANAHDFIMRLPDGYDTILSDNGNPLSEGEKQLICIARVMAIDPLILLLDEATAYLDTNTEKCVQEGLRNLMKGRTIIIVAHRLNTVRYADQIYVIENGEIIEHGKHQELINNHGIYEKMCKIIQ